MNDDLTIHHGCVHYTTPGLYPPPWAWWTWDDADGWVWGTNYDMMSQRIHLMRPLSRGGVAFLTIKERCY